MKIHLAFFIVKIVKLSTSTFIFQNMEFLQKGWPMKQHLLVACCLELNKSEVTPPQTNALARYLFLRVVFPAWL